MMAAAPTVDAMTGSRSSGAVIPAIVSSTNSVAANGVLYAAAKPAAVPAPTNTRVWARDVSTVRPTAAPNAPPTSINGPSRPMDRPPAIATHDDATRDAVAGSDNRTRP